MFYETMSDMFIDNRNCLAKRLKENNTSKEIIEESLNAFDFAVNKALELNETYKFVKEATIKVADEETWNKIEAETCKNFMYLNGATAQYHEDVEKGKRVGYSAEVDDGK